MKKFILILSIICLLSFFYTQNTSAQYMTEKRKVFNRHIKTYKLSDTLVKRIGNIHHQWSLSEVKNLIEKIEFIKEQLTPKEWNQFKKELSRLSFRNLIKKLKELQGISNRIILIKIAEMREKNSKK